MLKELLREAVCLIVGKQAEEIADLLDSRKHVNEFLIAKKMDITINQTRNLLYKILDHGLVSSIREKDKKKGWYTYFWKIEILKSLEFLKNIMLKRINQADHQIQSRETKQFYICERCNIEYNEENALLHDFMCNECGGVFKIKDNAKVLKEFKKNLNKFQNKLELVEAEIEIEKERLRKKKEKEIKAEKAKIEKIKAAKKKAMNKAKKAPAKKVKKKAPVKKSKIKKAAKTKSGTKVKKTKKAVKKVVKLKKLLKKVKKN